jgi:hypothetical protein
MRKTNTCVYSFLQTSIGLLQCSHLGITGSSSVGIGSSIKERTEA